MYRKKILVVEDSESLAYILEKFLEELGYEAVCAYNGQNGIKSVFKEDICLAIVDIGLPDISGLKVIDRIKEINRNLPIIVISKPKDIEGEIAIYEKGVNLFHKKPISFKLLDVQIKNLIPEPKNTSIKIEDITIDTEKGFILKDDTRITLTQMEKKCLAYLIESNGHSCSRENILKRLSINFNDRTEHCVDTLICRLRRKLAQIDKNQIIETVNGAGYRILLSREI